ncbi:MAG: metallophosphoesterase [Anaerolineae bacterium]
MGSVKILAITDQVVESLHSANVKTRFGDVDLIISCGDLPYNYLDYIVTVLGKPMYFVHGNHDRDFEYTENGKRYLAPRGAESLDMRSVVTPQDLILAGLEGSIRYDPRSDHQFTQEQMQRRALQLSLKLMRNRARYGRFLDILVTHSPPFGVNDGTDYAHIGFRAFNRLIHRFKPKLVLHGHQHIYTGTSPSTQVGPTRVVNVFPYQLITWERDREF